MFFEGLLRYIQERLLLNLLVLCFDRWFLLGNLEQIRHIFGNDYLDATLLYQF